MHTAVRPCNHEFLFVHSRQGIPFITFSAPPIPRPPRRPIFKAQEHRLRANADIRARSVRLIDEEGHQVGVLSLEDALTRARQAGLDLVEVSPQSTPPVCKILDFGKYQYQHAKKEKEQRKRQKRIEVKGIRIGFKTNTHDQGLRKKQTEQFLAEGDKVRVEIVLRGREKAHEDLARTILTTFMKSIEAPHAVEEGVEKSPRGFSVTLAPAKP